MKITFAPFLILLMLIPSIAFAEETESELESVTREFEFTSNTSDFEYTPPDQIAADEKVYYFKDIEYDLLSEEKLFTTLTESITKEVTEAGLSEKDDSLFAETMEIDEDDFVGTIPLKEIIYTEEIETDRVGTFTTEYDYGYQPSEPDAAKTLDVLVTDKRTGLDVLAILPLVELKIGSTAWEDSVHSIQVHRSVYDKEYLLSDGSRLSFLSESPEYEGCSDILLSDMRLAPEDYRITGSRWLNELSSSDGNYTRTAEYTVERLVTSYTAVYSGSFDLPDILTYTATAVYEGELSKEEPNGMEYQVKAIVTYEEKPVKKNTAATVAIVGGSSGVITLCGLSFILMKRRKQKQA